jgi:predicted nuclease of predicted toxin-antitoxin system
MNLYLDDNIDDTLLATLLAKAGYTVVRPADANLTGAPDPRHLDYAIRESRLLMTRDHEDFQDLHELILMASGIHPGILVVRYDNDVTRDMKPKDIVTAIRKLEQAGLDPTNQLIVLNHWR